MLWDLIVTYYLNTGGVPEFLKEVKTSGFESKEWCEKTGNTIINMKTWDSERRTVTFRCEIPKEGE
jgi:hypothetical protein